MYFPTHLSSFYFRSKLTNKRKMEILAWVKQLSKEELDLLDDIIQDSRADAQNDILDVDC